MDISGIGTGIASGLIGQGMGMMFNNDKRQVDQQKKLSDIQENANKRLMDKGMGLQKQMFDYTLSQNSAESQVKRLKEAGLNPALMYGLGGEGGTTGQASGSVGGGQASGSGQMDANTISAMGLGIEGAMMGSQIKVNEATANKLNADADLSKEQTTTESSRRDILVENMKQEGLSRFLENFQKDYEMNQGKDGQGAEMNNNVYEYVARITPDSYVMEGLTNALLKTEAETGNQEAQALLTNEKAKGYFQELQNEIMKAKAQGKQAENGETIALAIKLAAEFDTGVFTNWKTWTDLGIKGVDALGNIIGKVSPKGLIKEGAKSITKSNPVKGFK